MLLFADATTIEPSHAAREGYGPAVLLLKSQCLPNGATEVLEQTAAASGWHGKNIAPWDGTMRAPSQAILYYSVPRFTP